MFPVVWHANIKYTKTQVHKYTYMNTDLVKVPDRPTEDIKNNVSESVWRSNTQIVEVKDLHSSTGSN